MEDGKGKMENERGLMDWHCQDIEKVLKALDSSEKGLSSDGASKRLIEFGKNELIETKRRSPLSMFLDQFKDFMILVLIGAAIVSGVMGELIDTLAIVVIVIINAIIGFIQEYRAERAMKALKKMAAPDAVVIRDGSRVNIPASEIVPGDIVALEAGNIVPADMRLIETSQLKIEEAALTGESVPVEKTTSSIKDRSIPLGDRKNMAYKGTIVTYGRGVGVVVSTGMNTELGRIANLLQKEEEVKTPLQKRLARFGQMLSITVIGICAIVFFAGLMRGEEPVIMFLTAVSLAVAAVPEALPAVVTISLALGAQKMVRKNALIRKLPAVETLGSVTYICSDKTGTLTLNKMTVEKLYVDGRVIKCTGKIIDNDPLQDVFSSPVETILTCMALNNDASETRDGNIIGDPTEVALYQMAKDNRVHKKEAEAVFPRIDEIPFDSMRKRMTTMHRNGGGVVSFTKGAFESIIERSTHIITSNGIIELDDKTKNQLESVNEDICSQGYRTIAFGFRIWDSPPHDISPQYIENSLVFIGLAALMDPPREEVQEAVRLCIEAGIKPVMITGDHPSTAGTIAKRLGIIDHGDSIITGRELEEMDIDEFEERVEKIRVYARVAPEQKIKIVGALQDKGEFVAMTGDGVNDAPALKRADIGIAMGITGTDVAKEASHMILLDDNFATIVKAVKEGRRIFDNIRKFIRYTMTSNSGEIWTIFLAPFLGLPVPLLPIHILWVNLVTDGLPGLAYSVEPPEKDIMRRPPRDPDENIFTGMWFQIIWIGLLMGGICILTQVWAIKQGYEYREWQTMVFTILCLSQMGNAFALRSERESLFKIGIFSNMYMFGAVVLTFVLQMCIIYIPQLNPIFKTTPLNLRDLLITLIISSIVFFAVETEKAIRRRQR